MPRRSARRPHSAVEVRILATSVLATLAVAVIIASRGTRDSAWAPPSSGSPVRVSTMPPPPAELESGMTGIDRSAPPVALPP
ncbi:MAG: hypothetical protein ACT4P5_05145, partial [Armatimonadota bacterium]